MGEPGTLPAPDLHLPPPPRNKWEEEHHAFWRLLPGLLQTHRGKYVAVHEGRCVDSGDDLVALAKRVYARIGYLPIYMDLVTDQPVRPVRLPSPRVLAEG